MLVKILIVIICYFGLTTTATSATLCPLKSILTSLKETLTRFEYRGDDIWQVMSKKYVDTKDMFITVGIYIPIPKNTPPNEIVKIVNAAFTGMETPRSHQHPEYLQCDVCIYKGMFSHRPLIPSIFATVCKRIEEVHFNDPF